MRRSDAIRSEVGMVVATKNSGLNARWPTRSRPSPRRPAPSQGTGEFRTGVSMVWAVDTRRPGSHRGNRRRLRRWRAVRDRALARRAAVSTSYSAGRTARIASPAWPLRCSSVCRSSGNERVRSRDSTGSRDTRRQVLERRALGARRRSASARGASLRAIARACERRRGRWGRWGRPRSRAQTGGVSPSTWVEFPSSVAWAGS